MMRSVVYLLGTGVALVLLAGLLIAGQLRAGSAGVAAVKEKRRMVQALGLTDLALCSEARYTRHPSQADLFSAFQDFPAAFEHFPTGSMISPNPVGFDSRVSIRHQTEKGH